MSDIKDQDAPAKLHQKQMTLGVYIPLAVVGLLALATGVFISVKSQADATLSQTWGAIGLMLLILPTAIVAIIAIIVLVLAVYGMSKANHALPPRLRTFRVKAVNFNRKAALIADKATQPIVKLGSIKSGVDSAFSRLRKKK